MNEKTAAVAASVEFIDLDDGQKQIRDAQDLIGTKGHVIEYDPSQSIVSLEKQGYVLAANPFAKERIFGQKDDYRITFKHGLEEVTADNLKYGVNQEDLIKVGHQTVHYAGIGNRTPRDNVAEVKFYRTLVYDKVTGKQVDDLGFEDTAKNYPVVGTPSIYGYVPDAPYVGGDQVTAEDPDRDYTVSYQLSKRAAFRHPAAEVKYLDLDNHNEELESSGPIKGKANAPIEYHTESVLNKLADQGYEVAFNEFDEGGAQFFDSNQASSFIQTFIVSLKHQQVKVDEDHTNPAVESEEYRKQSSRLIKYVGVDESSTVQTINWHRSVTLDVVTKKLVEHGEFTTMWQPDQPEYPAVKVPVVDHYHTNLKVVPAQTAVMDNQVQEVHYQPNGYVIAVDDQGQDLGVKEQFATDPVDPSQVVKEIKAPEVEDCEPIKKDLTIKDPNQDVQAVYKVMHKYVPVDNKHPHEGIDPSYYQGVSQAIAHYQGAGEATPDDSVQTAHWERTVTFDEIEQKLVEHGKYTTEWQADLDQFDEVKVPVIKGYVANIGLVSAHEVTQNDLVATITYQPVGKIIAVDSSGTQLPTEPLSYMTDPYDASRVIINEPVPQIQGYLSDQKSVIIQNPIADTKVAYYLKPVYVKVNSLYPYKGIDPSEYEMTARFTVTYKGAGDETPDQIIQEVHWQRDITVNDVDGQIVDNGKYTTEWQADRDSLGGIQTPIVDGYHANQAEVPAIDADLHNHEATVIYRKNAHIEAIDKDGHLLKTEVFISDPDDATRVLNRQPAPRVKGYLPRELLVKTTDPDEDAELIYDRFGEVQEVEAKETAEADTEEKPEKPTIVIPKLKQETADDEEIARMKKSILN